MPRKLKPKPTDGFDARETWGRVTLRFMKELGQPITAADLVEEFDMHPSFARNKLNELLKKGMVHIKQWVDVPRANGTTYPKAVYDLGPGKNVRKPKRKSATQRQRETFQRAQDMFRPIHPGIGQREAYKLRARMNRVTKGATT